VDSASGQDVTTGDHSVWHVANGMSDLRRVGVLEQGMALATTIESALSAIPPVGQGFFYLIEERTFRGPAGYRTESGSWRRVPET
jgi:hypothetical protein